MFRIGEFLIIVGAVGLWSSTVAAAGTIDFNRDIRPILSENCYHCHGPDQAERQADLRLDQKEAVEASGAVVPGQPEESLLIERIISDDPEDRMPPPESKLSLTKTEKQLLKKWVECHQQLVQYSVVDIHQLFLHLVHLIVWIILNLQV